MRLKNFLRGKRNGHAKSAMPVHRPHPIHSSVFFNHPHQASEKHFPALHHSTLPSSQYGNHLSLFDNPKKSKTRFGMFKKHFSMPQRKADQHQQQYEQPPQGQKKNKRSFLGRFSFLKKKARAISSISEDDNFYDSGSRKRHSCAFFRKRWKQILVGVGLITIGVGAYLYTTSKSEDEKNMGAYLIAGGALAVLIPLSLACGCCKRRRHYEEEYIDDTEMA
jgi:hypothetical protein